MKVIPRSLPLTVQAPAASMRIDVMGVLAKRMLPRYNL